jgi:hypothetical protein
MPTCEQVIPVFLFDIHLVHRLFGVHISRCGDEYDVRVLSECLEHDRTLVHPCREKDKREKKSKKRIEQQEGKISMR